MSAKFPILLVDDDANVAAILNRTAIHSFPEASFIYVQDFAEATAYLNGLKGWGPKLVLLDIHLQTEPGGFEFLDLMRNHPIGRLVPVIILSATSASDNAIEAYSRGANSYTQKPFSYAGWKDYVAQLRHYWFETVTTPNLYFQPE